MKKSKVTALILAMVMAISLFTIPASAENLTAADALAVLKHVVGSQQLTEAQRAKLGYTADKNITSADALNVLKIVVGADTSSTPPPATAGTHEIMSFGGYDWRVLDVQDGKALLISDKVLEHRVYHNESVDITWADSDLRAYLNGEFYNSFSASDRARIVQVTNANPDNPWYGTTGGADTKDHIFLLRLDEVVKYFGDSGQLRDQNHSNNEYWGFHDQYNENRIAYHVGGTFTSERIGEYTVEAGEEWLWWLRSPGNNGIYAANVNVDGNLSVHGIFVNYGTSGVRPALWLNLG